MYTEPAAVQILSPKLEALCKTHNLSSSDINKKVQDMHILEIYTHIGNPPLVASHLSLEKSEISAIPGE